LSRDLLGRFRSEPPAQGRTTLRLCGWIQAEALAELETQIEGHGPHVTLDLNEVTLVDVGVVRFFLACEASGVELLACSPYIRHWMAREDVGPPPLPP
jgi:hypothetical protein